MRLRRQYVPAVCAVLLVLPCISLAQTPVDLLARKLDSLSGVSFDVWKVSDDLKRFRSTGDPTRPGFDDTSWSRLNINDRIYPDSCWIRKEIVIPTHIFGKPVSGPLHFLVSVDDYGYLWVNGKSFGYFPWDGDFDISGVAHPGEKVLVAIKAINTGGPLRLLRAGLRIGSIAGIQDLLTDLSLSFRIGQKLLSFDTYQTSSNHRVDPGIDKSTIDKAERKQLNDQLQSLATRLDLVALTSGSLPGFKASLNEVRTQLRPIRDFARRFTLYFDANAHIDAAWLWRSKRPLRSAKTHSPPSFT